MKRLLAPLLFVLPATVFAAAAHDAPGVQLHGHHFTTEFATNDAAREHGLMMRTELAADHSMLFVFPKDDQRWFWMKNTLIPLDILYFDGNRRLVSVQANVPPCKADPCPSYPSDLPARYVLELPAGMAAKIGAMVGDELTIEGTVGPVQ
ncbi:DUF192 domain-containing protein [Dyella solisilvae]|uniref:DUF192 domain-containing protein n=1 Tax=Dyella solisilvae TaxID=1920168 RepID=A0A370K2T0_9GAMM|nr:DUF192 domain-containing protein [Dyella solisilvae]RDI96952.1 DUF192 domain-containing protein [Dyella solisilvae]